jgi:hypothetical protein
MHCTSALLNTWVACSFAPLALQGEKNLGGAKMSSTGKNDKLDLTF